MSDDEPQPGTRAYYARRRAQATLVAANADGTFDVAPSQGAPAIRVDGHGVMTAVDRHMPKRMILTAVHMLGGVERLVEWAQEHPDNESAFWTKLFPRTIMHEVQVDDRRSIEDVIDAIDVTPVLPAEAGPADHLPAASFHRVQEDASFHRVQEDVERLSPAPDPVDIAWENDDD